MGQTIRACLFAGGLLACTHFGTAAAQSPRASTEQAEVGRAGASKSRSQEARTAPGARASAEATLHGRITLTAGPRQEVMRGEVEDTVIYFVPEAGADMPAPVRASAATYTKGFDPNLLVVPVGSTVRFPNRDVIIHNVFSVTPGSAFDLGNYGPGETRSQRFGKAGLVVVNCRVHRGMRVNVLVHETPHLVRPDADGRFRLADLPAGRGTLVIWHPRASAQSVAIDGVSNAPILRTLVANRPRVSSYL
jgi:plastocyanin